MNDIKVKRPVGRPRKNQIPPKKEIKLTNMDWLKMDKGEHSHTPSK